MGIRLPASLVKNFNRQLLVAKKNSPHIFFVGGVIASVASTVLACRATLKLNETLDEIQVDVNNVRELKHSAESTVEVIQEDGSSREYTPEEYHRDVVFVYTKAGMKLVKLYAPSIACGVIGISALTGAHIQLSRRNTALMAAYAALQKAYDEYRERVRDELGEERERDLYLGAETEKGEDGEKVKVISDPNKLSVYARFFDESSQNWRKEPDYNRIFLTGQQNFANNLLKSRGHLFLNEVYDMLDIERSPAGAVVGWVMNGDGDNFVDFGLYDARNSDFINGYERTILLDFNVDGVIYDKI